MKMWKRYPVVLDKENNMKLSDVKVGILCRVSSDIANERWGSALVEVYEIRQEQGIVGLKMIKSGECGNLSFRGLHHLNPVGKVR